MDVTHYYPLKDSEGKGETISFPNMEAEDALHILNQFEWNGDESDPLNLLFSTDNEETLCISQKNNGLYWIDFFIPDRENSAKIFNEFTGYYDDCSYEEMLNYLNSFFNDDYTTLISKLNKESSDLS